MRRPAPIVKRFEPALEARYQRALEPEKIALARVGGIVVVALNALYVLVDYFTMPGAFAGSLALRAVMIAGGALLYACSALPVFLRHYDWALGGFVLFLGIGVEAIVVLTLPGDVARGVYVLGIFIVTAGMFGMTFLNRPLEHAIAASLLLLHVGVRLLLHQAYSPTDIALLGAHVSAFACVWLIGLISQNARERYARQSFLHKCELESQLHIEAGARLASQELANRDPLTGLANRRMFEEVLAARIEAARLTGAMVAVTFIDLDRFKEINDRHGHVVGDAILRSAGQRIRAALDQQDCVARYGGDEFVVASSVLRGDAGERIAERVAACFADPVVEGTVQAHIGASLGSAAYPADGATPAELIAAADRRMYGVKWCAGTRPAAPQAPEPTG